MTEAELKYWQNWKPRPSDLDWTRRLIDSLKDGGRWILEPPNDNVFQIDKTNKVAVMTEGSITYLFYQIQKAFAALGWTVKVAAPAMETGSGKTQAGSQTHDLPAN